MGDIQKMRCDSGIRNIMEDAVRKNLVATMEKQGVCTCKDCQDDVVAYALNHLPPKYVSTYEGDVYSRIEAFTQQFEVDIQMAVAKGINVVSLNPRHKA
jgi:competence protein ComFB